MQLKLGEEILAQAVIAVESTQHGAGHHARLAFLDPAHHGAHMRALDQHRDPARVEDFLEGFSDLLGHALLHLQPAGEHFHQAGNLR